MVAIQSSIFTTPRAGAGASVQSTQLGFASALAMLSRFKELMARDGYSVDALRMLGDSTYAAEQLEWAHTSTAKPLRDSAMRVFALLHD